MNEEIVIEIAENGDVQVEGLNIAGPDCVALTKEIEQALGDVERTQLKPDYRRRPAVRRKVNQ